MKNSTIFSRAILLFIIYSLLFASPLFAQTPTVVTSGNGDVNNDGKADIQDILIVLKNYGASASSVGGANQYGDSIINLFDYYVVFNAMVYPTITSSKTPTPTVSSTTKTPTPAVATPTPTPTLPTISGKIYYLSKTGSNNNNGTSTSTPWASFSKAWSTMKCGDLLYIMDGTYTEALNPTINGCPNNTINTNDYTTYPLDHWERIKNYIHVWALNDGKVIIDGQRSKIPVMFGDYRQSGGGYYFDVRGIVAMNSSESVYSIKARNVILKRVSGYNGNTNQNWHVFEVDIGCCDADSTSCDQNRACTMNNPANVLIEDAIAAGTGRKMVVAYASYVNIIFRRVFAAWTSWRGGNCTQDECAAHWPWGDGIEIYNWHQPDLPDGWNNSIIENSILYGRIAKWGFSLSPNSTVTYNNNFLGNIAVKAGLDWNGTQMNWPCPNPVQSWFPCPKWTEWQAMRSGFSFGAHGNSLFKDNLFQDLFAYGNGGVGIATGPYGAGSGNNRLIRGTFINNGLASNLPPAERGQNVSPLSSTNNLSSVVDLCTSVNCTQNKAQLNYRYVNGVMTNERLWPWPMEERIKNEMAAGYALDNGTNNQNDPGTPVVWNNFSVTDEICTKILKNLANLDATCW